MLYRQNYSMLNTTFVGQRKPGYYLVNFLLPLTFIQGVAYFSLWMKPSSARRVSVSGVGLIGTLAFSISTNGVLPPVSYVTRLAALCIETYSFVVSVVLMNLVIWLLSYLAGEIGRLDALHRKEALERSKLPATDGPKELNAEELVEIAAKQGPSNKCLYVIWWLFSERKYAETNICFCIKVSHLFLLFPYPYLSSSPPPPPQTSKFCNLYQIRPENQRTFELIATWINIALKWVFLLAILVVIPTILASPFYVAIDY